MPIKPQKDKNEKKQNSKMSIWMPRIIAGGIFYLIGVFLILKQNSYQRAYPKKNFIEVFNIMMEELVDAPFYFPKSPTGAGPLIMVFTFLAALFALYLYYKEDANKYAKHGTEEGSSKFMNENDIKKWNRTYSSPGGSEEHNGPINTIMTDEIYLSMDTKQTRRNLNTLVVGGSGAGKSRFFVKPNLCEMPLNCSFVCTDPSGELLAETGSMLEGAGYKLKVFNLVEMSESDLYNPLRYVNTDNDVILLVDCILANTTDPNKKGGDDFWEKAQKLMFQALIFFIHNYGEKFHLKKNLNSLMQLMDGISISEETQSKESGGRTQEYFNALEKTGWYFDEEGKWHAIPESGSYPAGCEAYPALTEEEQRDSITLKQWHKFMSGAGKTLKSILISAMARLSTLDSSSVAQLLSDDTIDLKSIGDEKTALFVIIPQENDSFNFLAAMLYTQLFQSMYFHAERECQGNYVVVDSKGENVKIFEVPHKTAHLIDNDLFAEEIDIEFADNEQGYKEINKENDKETNKENNEEEVTFDKEDKVTVSKSKKMPGDNSPSKKSNLSKNDDTILESVNFQNAMDRKDTEIDEDPGEAVEDVEKKAKDFAAYLKDNVKCTKKGRFYIIKCPSKDKDGEDEIIGMYSQQYFAKQRYEAIKAGCHVTRLGLHLPYHVRFLLDEFANIGSIPDFSKKLATCRKYSISATIILQSINQLKVKYKDDWGTIIGNCDSFLFLGAQEQDTLEYVSKMLGKKTQKTRSTSHSKGGKGGGSNSDNWKGRELMTIDELRRMDNSECIYILRGEYPYKGKKHQFITHPNYPFTADGGGDTFIFYKKEPEKKFETWELRYDKNIAEKYPEEASKLPIFSGTSTHNLKIDTGSTQTSINFNDKKNELLNNSRMQAEEKELFIRNINATVAEDAKDNIEMSKAAMMLADSYGESDSESVSRNSPQTAGNTSNSAGSSYNKY